MTFGDAVKCVNESCTDPAAQGLHRIVGLEHLEPEDLRIRRWADISEGTSFTRVFRQGQVLFGKRRAYQRKVALADFDGICSGDILVFEARPEVLLPELLPFIVQSEGFFEHALGTSAGSLSPRTRWSDLADYELSLPALDEQRRIADVLWASEGLRRCLCESARDADTLQKASERALLEWAATQASKQGVRAQRLDELADVAYGLTLNSARQSLPSRHCYLRVANVQRAHIDLSEVKEVGCTSDEVIRYQLRPGDILVVEGHAVREEIGRAALWKGTPAVMLHQNHLLRVRCGASLLPEYLLMVLNSDHGRRYLQTRAKSTSGLNTINSRVVKQFTLPVPAVSTQKRICEQVCKLSAASVHLGGHIASVAAMHRRLADELLCGPARKGRGHVQRG